MDKLSIDGDFQPPSVAGRCDLLNSEPRKFVAELRLQFRQQSQELFVVASGAAVQSLYFDLFHGGKKTAKNFIHVS